MSSVAKVGEVGFGLIGAEHTRRMGELASTLTPTAQRLHWRGLRFMVRWYGEPFFPWAMAAASLTLIWPLGWVFRLARQARDGRCLFCGYQRPSTARRDPCPECGRARDGREMGANVDGRASIQYDSASSFTQRNTVPKFRISGINRDTGKTQSAIIEAATAEEATRMAGPDLLVASTEGPFEPPRPAVADLAGARRTGDGRYLVSAGWWVLIFCPIFPPAVFLAHGAPFLKGESLRPRIRPDQVWQCAE